MLNLVARGCVGSLFAFVIISCAPTVRPVGPGDGAGHGESSPALATSAKSSTPGAYYVIGEMCPKASQDRPAVAPVIVKGVRWDADTALFGQLMERAAVARFTVLGRDGNKAGTFMVVGVAEGKGEPLASGSYTGASPCANPSGAEDAACLAATKGCGLALGTAGTGPGEVVLAKAGSCVVGEQLLVDLDGNGARDAIALKDLLDTLRAPAQEVAVAEAAEATCNEQFSHYGLSLPVAPAKPGDNRYAVTMDVLAVTDVDGDGRHELIAALHYGEVRTVVVFTTVRKGDATKLELAGEVKPWADAGASK